MTTEPKFVPATATTIQVDDFTASIRMIDCVGYVIDAAKLEFILNVVINSEKKVIKAFAGNLVRRFSVRSE
jgi:nickel-dependent lactate racemase